MSFKHKPYNSNFEFSSKGILKKNTYMEKKIFSGGGGGGGGGERGCCRERYQQR